MGLDGTCQQLHRKIGASPRFRSENFGHRQASGHYPIHPYLGREREERLPLVALGSTRVRASKFTEEELGEEMLKLLESKEGEARNDSLNGGSEDESFDLDFSEDELGDITVNQSRTHVEDSSSLAGRRQEEHSYFEGQQQFGQPNGIGNGTVTPVVQPVLTKQGIMELVGKDVGAIAPGSGWKQRKQSYCDLLKGEGYESPTGSTVRASLELAALMVISAVSENTTRVSLMAQREQNEKLIRQAEQHRELVQKEFTESMQRPYESRA